MELLFCVSIVDILCFTGVGFILLVLVTQGEGVVRVGPRVKGRSDHWLFEGDCRMEEYKLKLIFSQKNIHFDAFCLSH
jgi:hypothetical protein